MTHMKKTGQMTFEPAKEITDKIDYLEEQATQGSFVSYGHQNVLTATIRQPEHPGRVCAIGANVTIKHYFGLASKGSRTSSSMAAEDLEQLTRKIRDQLKVSIIQKVTQQLMMSFNQMQSQMKTQELALPFVAEVGPSAGHVSTKESCIDSSRQDPETGNSDKFGLYVDDSLPRLVAFKRVYEGSMTIHNVHLGNGQVKVGVEEVRDVDTPVHDKRVAEGPMKPVHMSNPDVDPLYLMTLTIPVFRVDNDNFSLYIKHEVLFEIAHGGQCLSISVIQLWILEVTLHYYYIKKWMHNSQRDVYLGAYLNDAHWQMVIILPKDNVVIWFCSLHNRPDNYLQEIINRDSTTVKEVNLRLLLDGS
ncbi:hypothetical protein GmHk_20G057788 [Glycine max]|nr:hypothetical protein GmHk_20G057788 [Glycine max]